MKLALIESDLLYTGVKLALIERDLLYTGAL
jgi:hypothetical protein